MSESRRECVQKLHEIRYPTGRELWQTFAKVWQNGASKSTAKRAESKILNS